MQWRHGRIRRARLLPTSRERNLPGDRETWLGRAGVDQAAGPRLVVSIFTPGPMVELRETFFT